MINQGIMVYLVFMLLRYIWNGGGTIGYTVNNQELVYQDTYMFQGVRVLKPPAPYFISSLEPNQTFSVDVYVNTYTKEEFFGHS